MAVVKPTDIKDMNRPKLVRPVYLHLRKELQSMLSGVRGSPVMEGRPAPKNADDAFDNTLDLVVSPTSVLNYPVIFGMWIKVPFLTNAVNRKRVTESVMNFLFEQGSVTENHGGTDSMLAHVPHTDKFLKNGVQTPMIWEFSWGGNILTVSLKIR